MAYAPHTWVARIGTKLNRYLKQNEDTSYVELVNSPTAITEAGTEFSVDWMNELENGLWEASAVAEPRDETERVFHLNGDYCPDIPDAESGTTYLWDKASLDSWAISGTGTIAYASSIITATSTASGDMGITRAVSSSAKEICGYIKSSVTGTVGVYATISGVSTLLGSFSVVAGVKKYVEGYTASTFTAISFVLLSSVSGNTIKLYDAYVGTGEYSTKLVDHSGHYSGTNYGALPVNSPFGKGLDFNKYGYIEFSDPVLGTSGKVQIYAKFHTLSYQQDFFSNIKFAADGISARLAADNDIEVNFANITYKFLTRTIITSTSVFYGISISWNSSSVSVFINGELFETKTLSSSPIPGTENLTIGTGYGKNTATRLSALIAHFAYSSEEETEEAAMQFFLNPKSVDSQARSSVPLANAVMQWPDSPSGTFTPYLTFGGATTGITYTLQFGYYQLVGKRCDFSLRITLSSKGTATGIAVVNGLPFTSFSSSSTMSALAIAISSITYTGFPQALVVTSATSISLQYANEAGTTTNMTDTNFSNGSILVINGSYFIA